MAQLINIVDPEYTKDINGLIVAHPESDLLIEKQKLDDLLSILSKEDAQLDFIYSLFDPNAVEDINHIDPTEAKIDDKFFDIFQQKRKTLSDIHDELKVMAHMYIY